MVQMLESLAQRLSGHDVVVAGSERTGSRQAMLAPDLVSSGRLPAADPDRFNPYGVNPNGLRAGRSVGVSGSLLSRRFLGQAGATSRTRGASPSAVKPPSAGAKRGVLVTPVSWCLGRMCRTPVTTGRRGPRTRPVI
jgi:hypothetical protein